MLTMVKTLFRVYIFLVMVGVLSGLPIACKFGSVNPTVKLPPEGMVLIPAGDFQMGRNDPDKSDEPVHMVYMEAFYIDKYEVTNAQYKRFVDANPQWQKDRIYSFFHDGRYLNHWNGNSYPSGKGSHPVGKRLPTEVQWEKAAQGGLSAKKYPWGDVNVWEWCRDKYIKNSSHENPLSDDLPITLLDFTNFKTYRVLRGGPSIYHRYWNTPTSTGSNIGFRCVRDRTD